MINVENEKYRKIFTMLVEAVAEDISKDIYVLPDGFEVDMSEIEKAGDIYE